MELYTYAYILGPMLREIFKEVKQSCGVTGKSIAQQTGISEKHISEFLRGKRDVTSETLWRMIEAMEEICPGSRSLIAEKLGGRSRVILNFDELDEDQLADCMVAIGRSWKNRQNRKNSSYSNTLAIR